MSQVAPVQTAIERSLAERIRDKDSGIWTVTDGKVRRLFCFRKGRLIFAASNIIEEQIDEFLVREGYVSQADYDRSKLEAAREGVPSLTWLQQREVLSAAKLGDAVAAHTIELLDAAMTARAPEGEFQKGIPNLEGKPVTDLSPQDLLFEFLKTHPKSYGEVRTRLGRPGMHPVRVKTREKEIEELAEIHPVVGQVWGLCGGELSATQVAQRVTGGAEPAMRTLYGLVLIGALKAAEDSTRKGDVPVTRKELLARLDRAIGSDHYSVLELMSGATEEQIRSSYYVLARRYHPDRLRSSEYEDLLQRIEQFFAQVTEAYNTLSDPALRKAYDKELDAATAKSRTKTEPEHDTGYLARQNFLRAKALVKRNQYQQAVQFLENAIKLEENVPEYHVEFGKVLSRNPRRRDEAEEHLRRGIELNPTVVDGHVALAALLIKLNRKETAERILTEALKWHPDHPELTRQAEKLGGKGRRLFGR